MDNQKRYRHLADKLLKGTITPEEMKEYQEWYDRDDDLPIEIPSHIAESETEHEARLLDQINTRKKTRRTIRIHPALRVAASVIVVVGIGILGWMTFNPTQKAELSASLPREQRYKNDIDPAWGGVTLTLNNGTALLLDTIANGRQLSTNTQNIAKYDSSIQYASTDEEDVIVYNTLTTSKGRTYRLVLADGTEVWLDAQSSITFPTSFPGNERVVEVTGQVYFEVASNKLKPFRVRTAGETIEVLGTHFNVNAYTKEIKTTLLEGSVKIGSKKLAPGEQSVETENKIAIRRNVDVDEIMAWKTGRFRFNGAQLTEIMQQLERWYDIEVEYDETLPEMQLVARINRDLPISRILQLLEMTNQVAFVIDGNTVKIMNAKK